MRRRHRWSIRIGRVDLSLLFLLSLVVAFIATCKTKNKTPKHKHNHNHKHTNNGSWTVLLEISDLFILLFRWLVVFFPLWELLCWLLGETKAMRFAVDKADGRFCCSWLWGLLVGGAG